MDEYRGDPSPNLINILTGCFEIDPEKRIDSSTIITHPFFQVENMKYKDLPQKVVYEAFMSCRNFKPNYLF